MSKVNQCGIWMIVISVLVLFGCNTDKQDPSVKNLDPSEGVTALEAPTELELQYDNVDYITDDNGEVAGCKISATASWKIADEKTSFSTLLISKEKDSFEEATKRSINEDPHLGQRYFFRDYVLAKDEVQYLGVYVYVTGKNNVQSKVAVFQQALSCTPDQKQPVVAITDLEAKHIRLSHAFTANNSTSLDIRFDIKLLAELEDPQFLVVLHEENGEVFAELPLTKDTTMVYTGDPVEETKEGIKILLQVIGADPSVKSQVLEMGTMTLRPPTDEDQDLLHLTCETKKMVTVGINPNAEPNMPYLTVKVEGADINHLQAMAVCSAGGCRIGTRDSQVTVENIAPGGDVCILKLQDKQDPEHFIIEMIVDGMDVLRVYQSKKVDYEMICEVNDKQAFLAVCDETPTS